MKGTSGAHFYQTLGKSGFNNWFYHAQFLLTCFQHASIFQIPAMHPHTQVCSEFLTQIPEQFTIQHKLHSKLPSGSMMKSSYVSV
jgi:hypothetical protein